MINLLATTNANINSPRLEGWDDYAPFYDWENARTLGRRDVPFWRRVALQAKGRVLELGCGTGRVTLTLAKAGVPIVGVDRSSQMLARLRSRVSRARFGVTVREGTTGAARPGIIRADIRQLPFASRSFNMALAPYGILQSLLNDNDLRATLDSVSRVLEPGGTFGIDLVPDVPNWREYQNKVQLRGRAAGGARLTLIESVRQDLRRHRTTFEQCYVERKGRHVRNHRFELTFRTLSVRQMTSRLERAGFRLDAILGDYRGRPWDPRADVWIMMARRW